MVLISKAMVVVGSVASIGFGIWHFFVPSIWRWSAYIDTNATELAVAVRAINVFFSLSLVLFGGINILLSLADRSDRYSLIVVLAATCVLWLTRVALQIIYPQGLLYPGLRYSMLATFVAILLCYVIPLVSLVSQRIPSDGHTF